MGGFLVKGAQVGDSAHDALRILEGTRSVRRFRLNRIGQAAHNPASLLELNGKAADRAVKRSQRSKDFAGAIETQGELGDLLFQSCARALAVTRISLPLFDGVADQIP